MSVIAHRKLTQKQQRFLTEYLKDMDAVQAALRAGYSQTNAEVMARQNLKNPEIQCAIRAALSGQSQIVTKDNVLREFARIAFVDPRKLFRSDGSPKPIEELDTDTAAALAGLEVREEFEGAGENRAFVGYTKKYKLANKLGALDSLAKHLGMLDGKGREPENEENENGCDYHAGGRRR